VATSPAEFETYFDKRASRFAAFYRSRPVAWLLGRGPLFDRLDKTVDLLAANGAKTVLDVGCGSGPLFAPLAGHGINVTGIDPAPAMVALAQQEAAKFPGKVRVVERGWEQIDEVDAYDAAAALGVFDYVDDPGDLLGRLGRAARVVIGSFPSPGLRLRLRQVRYGARGVHVHGYTTKRLEALAADCGLRVGELLRLGRAGHLVMFERPAPAPGDRGTTPTAR
jgi:SAM-dependent methyltransferase